MKIATLSDPPGRRLRAIIEVLDDGCLRILPIANSDEDTKQIAQALGLTQRADGAWRQIP